VFSLKDKSDQGILAGISFSQEGIALAIVKHTPKSVNLELCQFYPCSVKEQVETLSELVRAHKLGSIPCNFVLQPEEYQLLQVDTPEVPKQELTAALRWQIKDLIDFHIDDAAIEHISLPDQGTSGKNQLLVIASRSSVIQSHVDTFQAANCHLSTIDIAIQAARNIIAKVSTAETSIGVLNLWNDSSKISVLLNQDIYINRSSSIGLESLSFVSEDDYNSQSILDSLALELQRTFDYYESHARQASLTHLFILSNGPEIKNIDQLLQQRIGINCFNINVLDAVTVNESVKNTMDNRCTSAIGGALRSSM